jgi:predicted XRE-type DNA-binding protein
MTRTAKTPFTRSSGNVFEDLRPPAPSKALAKSELAAIVAVALRSRRLTQTAAAQLLGIDQPKVSELLRGRLTRFSTERLLVFLLRLGRDVDIVVWGAPVGGRGTAPGRIHVWVRTSTKRGGAAGQGSAGSGVRV